MKIRFRIPDRRYVYVFNVKPESEVIPSFWIGKVGFSADDEKRAADIERSIFEKYGVRVKLVRWIRVKVFWYRGIEKAVHNVLKVYKTQRFRDANGGTEFFWTFNALAGLLVYVVLWGLGLKCAVWIGIGVMGIPRPVDMCICVLFLAAFEYAVMAVLIYAAYLGGVTLIGL